MTVRVESIRKSFGEQLVLDNVSCEFPDKKISTVLGVSGCGKTTLLRIIAGLEDPDEGEVYIDEVCVTDRSPQDRRLSMVFQDLASYPHLSVETNLMLPLLAKGLQKDLALTRTRNIAQRFEIDSLLGRQAGLLSGGELQRLALGRAIIKEPRVMLLDEPFSHLDAPLQRESRKFIFSELSLTGTTSVLVTHNHQDAQEAGGPVFFLDKGRIVQHGSWEDLYWRAATPRIAQVVSFLEPVVIPGKVEGTGNELRFKSDTIPLYLKVDEELANCWPPDQVRGKIFFRPEVLKVNRAGKQENSNSTLYGNVISTFLQGSTRFCRFAGPDGIIVEARTEDFNPVPGESVSVTLDGATQLLLWPDGI